MADADPLSGFSVLVLEDDYYLADDARTALEAAGAKVIGPCSTAADAVALADRSQPDCALVDVNLGAGPSFAVAEEFIARGVPIVFVTGYDSSVIPQKLAHVPCLQKPTDARKIVAAIGKLCAR